MARIRTASFCSSCIPVPSCSPMAPFRPAGATMSRDGNNGTASLLDLSCVVAHQAHDACIAKSLHRSYRLDPGCGPVQSSIPTRIHQPCPDHLSKRPHRGGTRLKEGVSKLGDFDGTFRDGSHPHCPWYVFADCWRATRLGPHSHASLRRCNVSNTMPYPENKEYPLWRVQGRHSTYCACQVNVNFLMFRELPTRRRHSPCRPARCPDYIRLNPVPVPWGTDCLSSLRPGRVTPQLPPTPTRRYIKNRNHDQWFDMVEPHPLREILT